MSDINYSTCRDWQRGHVPIWERVELEFRLEKGDMVAVDDIDEIGIVDGGPYYGLNPDSGWREIYYRIVWDTPPFDDYLYDTQTNEEFAIMKGHHETRYVCVGTYSLHKVEDRFPYTPEQW